MSPTGYAALFLTRPVHNFAAYLLRRLQTLVRQFEHTVGANSFFVACLRSSPVGGPRLVGWQSALEAAIRFESGGVRRWVRPDGAGEVVLDGARHRFFLEWDRGTERLAVLMAKLARYALYYRVLGECGGSPLPQILAVTTTPQREGLIRKAASMTFSQAGTAKGLVLTSTDSLIHRLWPFGLSWRYPTRRGRAEWPIRDQRPAAQESSESQEE